jgi:hypothetical protein
MRNALTWLAVAVFLSPYAVAQGVHGSVPSQSPSKIRIVFPDGISGDEVWLVYGLYAPCHGGDFIGLDGPVAKVRRSLAPRISGQGRRTNRIRLPAFSLAST